MTTGIQIKKIEEQARADLRASQQLDPKVPRNAQEEEHCPLRPDADLIPDDFNMAELKLPTPDPKSKLSPFAGYAAWCSLLVGKGVQRQSFAPINDTNTNLDSEALRKTWMENIKLQKKQKKNEPTSAATNETDNDPGNSSSGKSGV